jgi:hypothetical protein
MSDPNPNDATNPQTVTLFGPGVTAKQILNTLRAKAGLPPLADEEEPESQGKANQDEPEQPR